MARVAHLTLAETATNLMQHIISWVIQNKEWFLSGIGIAIPLTIVGWWLQAKSPRPQQSIKSGQRSINIQSGGNVTIGTDSTEVVRAIRMRELADFRQSIHKSAMRWEELLNEAERVGKTGGKRAGAAAMLKSAAELNKIVTAYRLNRHLFTAAAQADIDAELRCAESDSEHGLIYLIKAIQLINSVCENTSKDYSGN